MLVPVAFIAVISLDFISPNVISTASSMIGGATL